ncbi:MAG: hypothetical protein SVT52_02690 [Planctomycetota bacterium]|nr:hypothetical protein [Planctomycetota bacterium]
MKPWMIILSVLAILPATTGCERKTPPEEPTAYDVEKDGPPNPVVLNVDPDIVADQREISRRVERESIEPPAVPAGTESPKAPAAPAKVPTEAKVGKTTVVTGGGKPILTATAPAETPQAPKAEKKEAEKKPPQKTKRKGGGIGGVLKRITKPVKSAGGG